MNKIIITFSEEDVISRGPGFIELSTQSHQSPKFPAFVRAIDSRGKLTNARYLLVTAQRGSLKMGEENK